MLHYIFNVTSTKSPGSINVSSYDAKPFRRIDIINLLTTKRSRLTYFSNLLLPNPIINYDLVSIFSYQQCYIMPLSKGTENKATIEKDVHAEMLEPGLLQ